MDYNITDTEKYLNLLYSKVRKVSSISKEFHPKNKLYPLYTYFVCAEHADSPTYALLDGTGTPLLEKGLIDIDIIGPFLIMCINMPDVEAYLNKDTIEAYRYINLSIIVKQADLVYSSVIELLSTGKYIPIRSMISVSTLKDIRVTNKYSGFDCLDDDKYIFYKIRAHMAATALFDRDGNQLTPFAFTIADKAEVVGSKIRFSSSMALRLGNTKKEDLIRSQKSSSIRYLYDGRRNTNNWSCMQYDILSNKMDYLYVDELEPGKLYRYITRLEDTGSILDVYSMANRTRYNAVYRLGTASGELLGKEYFNIEPSRYKLYGRPIFEVHSKMGDNRGYIAENGFELIPPGKFIIATPIEESELYHVVDCPDSRKATIDQRFGVFNALTQTFTMEMSKDIRYSTKNIGDLSVIVSSKQGRNNVQIIGNDGKEHDSLAKAFTVYSGVHRETNKVIISIIAYGSMKYYEYNGNWKWLKLIDQTINVSDYIWNLVR